MTDTDPPPLTTLLVHGLLSSPQEFGLINHALRMRGVRHEALSIPEYTFGSQCGRPDWKQWRSAAVEIVTARAAMGRPVILGGLCMGGVLAAAAALEVPGQVAGLVLLSPSFEFDGWGQPWIRHLRHVAYWTGLHPFFAMTEQHPFGVKSEKIRKWVAGELSERSQSAAGPARVSLTVLREGERLLAHVRSRLSELGCPLLVIHARDDEISSLAGVQRVFDQLPQKDKQLVVLENSYHMITIDNDRHQVTTLLAEFSRQVSSMHCANGKAGAASPFVLTA